MEHVFRLEIMIITISYRQRERWCIYLNLMQCNGTVFVDVNGFEDDFEVVFMLQHVIGELVEVQEIVTIIVGTTHEHLGRAH